MEKKDTFKQAGYVSCKSLGHGEFLLTDETGKKEVWFSNKNHVGYAIRYKNTHLEFARSLTEHEDLEIEKENSEAQESWDNQNIFEKD